MKSFETERMSREELHVLTWLSDDELRNREDEQREIVRLNVVQ